MLKRTSTQFKYVLLIVTCTFLAACSRDDNAEPEPAAKLYWQQVSKLGLYTVSIEPLNSTIPIGQYHEWILSVHDSSGKPVASPRVAVNGGMPSHGHGLPSQPQVSEHLGQGRHRIEGMRFNMGGAWVLEFQIQSTTGTDQVQFELELNF